MVAVERVRPWAVLAIAACLLAACAGRVPPRESRPAAAPADVAAVAAVPASPVAAPAPQPQPRPDEDAGPAPGAPAAEPADDASFSVSREVYSRTFGEVEAFIRTMDAIIQGRDFATWQEHLTQAYRDRVSDPAFLEEQSRQPLLQKNGVRLTGLEDYFERVVVPSRSGASLDDIEFIDEEHVKAISFIRGTRGVLYLLVREGGCWKIGIW